MENLPANGRETVYVPEPLETESVPVGQRAAEEAPAAAEIEPPSTGDFPTIEYVDPHQLKPASWNPAVRTRERNLRTLMTSMRQFGFWAWEPIQLALDEQTNEWVIADGHRRWTAAKLLDIRTVPVIRIRNLSAQQYWSQKNGTLRGVSIKETSAAIAHGLEYVPPSHQHAVGDLLSLYGNDWGKIRELCMGGVNVSIANYARRVANYCGFREDSELRDEFLVRTIQWLSHQRRTMMVSRAMQDGVAPELLMEKIASGEPLKAGYS